MIVCTAQPWPFTGSPKHFMGFHCRMSWASQPYIQQREGGTGGPRDTELNREKATTDRWPGELRKGSPVTWSCFIKSVLGGELLSRVQFFETLWTVAHQAPLSMGFFRQEYWSGFPFHPPGGCTDPGTKHMSLVSPVLTGEFFTGWAIGRPKLSKF